MDPPAVGVCPIEDIRAPVRSIGRTRKGILDELIAATRTEIVGHTPGPPRSIDGLSRPPGLTVVLRD